MPCVNNVVNACVNMMQHPMEKESMDNFIRELLSFIIVIIIISFSIKIFWNDYLVPAVTIARPLQTSEQALGLALLINLII